MFIDQERIINMADFVEVPNDFTLKNVATKQCVVSQYMS